MCVCMREREREESVCEREMIQVDGREPEGQRRRLRHKTTFFSKPP